MHIFGTEIDFADTFDTSTALSSMYLWLLFAFLSPMINCDLQMLIKRHEWMKHIVAIVAFFFLFTIIDQKNNTNLATIWVKTFFVYFLFILTTKSKWYFAIPTIALLLIDQSVKKSMAIRQAKSQLSASTEMKYKEASRLINVIVTTSIITGVIHYFFLQKHEKGSAFSFTKFLFGIGCKTLYAPTVQKL